MNIETGPHLGSDRLTLDPVGVIVLPSARYGYAYPDLVGPTIVNGPVGLGVGLTRLAVDRLFSADQE